VGGYSGDKSNDLAGWNATSPTKHVDPDDDNNSNKNNRSMNSDNFFCCDDDDDEVMNAQSGAAPVSGAASLALRRTKNRNADISSRTAGGNDFSKQTAAVSA